MWGARSISLVRSAMEVGKGTEMKIDAHQHFWELSRFSYDWLQAPALAPIRRDFLPDDLLPHLQACGIDRSIFVQTRHDLAENRWVLSLCEQYDFLAGIVGWVDLRAPDCEAQLLEFKDHPRFLGVRHVTQDEPDEDFIVRTETLRGLKVLEKHGVPFDLLFFVKHLRHAETVARACPDLPLVIDHLAKPRIREQGIEDWDVHFRAASRQGNVYCKLSGMVTEAAWRNWRPADFQPYLERALEYFGPQRLMFGSDWPVCELAASYEEVFGIVRDFISRLSPDEQAEILGGTAARFYGIPL